MSGRRHEGAATPGAPRDSGVPAHLAAVLSISADAIVSVDEAQRIVFFNEGAERIFGYACDEVLGRSLDLLLPERFRGPHAAHIRAFAEADVTARLMGERMQIAALRKGGGEFPAEASIAKTAGPGGMLFTIVLRDVTAQRAAQRALARRGQQLAEAQHIARLGSWEWDITEDEITWSDELYQIYGLEAGQAIDFDTFLTAIHPHDRERMRATIEAALASGEPFEVEHRIVRPDGSVRRLHGRGEILRGDDGRPVRMRGTALDVTERAEAEEKARRLAAEQAARQAAEAAERRMAFLARASAELASSLEYETTLRTIARLAVPTVGDWAAVDIVDDDGEVQRLAVEHTDPDKVAMVRRIQERYPPDRDAATGVYRVIRTGESNFLPEIPDEVLTAVAKDDEHLRLLRELHLRSAVIAPLAARGRVLGAITLVYAESGRRYTDEDRVLLEDLGRRAGMAVDNARLVLELEQARERLQDQAAELEVQTEELEAQNQELQATAEDLAAASRAKGDFMATVSHELRTPLNAIIGYAELLYDGVPESIPATAKVQVQRIRLSARHLLQLIDEILTFSALEAGQQRVELGPLELPDLLDEVRAIIEPLARDEGLTFTAVLNGGPEQIVTDTRKVRQILLNLLGNAVKFTERGQVELRVSQVDDTVLFQVSDTGPGISDADLQLLFEPFWQADQSRSRRVSGAGLGLSISGRLARMLGGEILVDTEIGRGSTFTLRLPIRT